MNNISEHKTAILIFANSSHEELRHKGIVNGIKMFDAMTEKTLVTVEKTGLPYFHFSEKHQEGSNFGERFTNAIQAIFIKGFDKIITIGNDSPQLKSSHILEASIQLNNNKFVLGPSTDGGFYLMGIHKSQFNSSDFTKLAWQTSSLSKQLLRLMKPTSIAVFKLPTFMDIDAIEDIKALLNYTYLLPATLIVIFTTIIHYNEKIPGVVNPCVSRLHTNSFHNKGSPLVLQL